MVILSLEASGGEELVPYKLVRALIVIESGGNDNAVGDKHLAEKAYGCLQIRKPCLEDVNTRFRTLHKPVDCLGNRKLSVWVLKSYMSMYATPKRIGRNPTLEDMARIWNGGPGGWRNPRTEGYWRKVLRELEKQG